MTQDAPPAQPCRPAQQADISTPEPRAPDTISDGMRPGDSAASKPGAAGEAQQAAGEVRNAGARHRLSKGLRDLAILVLLGCALLGLARLPPDATARVGAAISHLPQGLADAIGRCRGGPRACITAAIRPPARVTEKTVTLAVHRDIEALLDGYGPFLRADTALLRGPYQTEGQAANDDESWVLPATAGKVGPACAQLLHHSHGCQPSLGDACRRLTHNLTFAAEDHRRAARSLAGPRADGLWLYRVEGPLLGLVWSLENMDAPRQLAVPGPDAAGPRRAAADDDGLAGDETGRMTAQIVGDYVSRQRDPWRSANSIIRRPLLSLREKCASIAADMRLLSDPGGPGGACRWAELSPLVGPVEELVSAVDDDLAALDAVDDALLRLGWWLERMPGGRLDVDDVVGDTVVRTRFVLPAPAVISRSVAARLERMRDDASALQRAWIAPTRLATGSLGIRSPDQPLEPGHDTCTACPFPGSATTSECPQTAVAGIPQHM